ncbi:MAG: response regulator [Longimicrobiales bacterium]
MLLVEDNADHLVLTKATLREHVGIHLHVVSDGQQAIDYLHGIGAFADRAEHPLPDAVILDIHMPRLSGLGVLQWMKERGLVPRLPVLVWTGVLTENEKARARALGAWGVIEKPANFAILGPVVRDMLRGRRGRRAADAS